MNLRFVSILGTMVVFIQALVFSPSIARLKQNWQCRHGRYVLLVQAAVNAGTDNNDVVPVKTIKDEISEIISKYLETGDTINPVDLVDNAYILAQGRLYEEVIEEKLQNSLTAENAADVERLDSILRGFIVAERKSRSRLKVNYLMAGASTGRLEQAIQMLSDR